ncbi:MAG: hypothetical protein PVI90_13835 [Desulfobacteraceae bacterium]
MTLNKCSKNKMNWSVMLIGLTLVGIITLTGCSDNSGSSSSSDTDSDSENLAVQGNLFPRGLAVTSPFDVVDANESASLIFHNPPRAISSSATFRYHQITEAISDILDAQSAGLCTFDPELFMVATTNADCYGPTVLYENHPDGTPADGELPGGDVGIWMETADNNNACAAAQLNARIQGVRDRTKASLMGLASIICAINNDTSGDYTFPENSTLDVTDIMPEPTGVTWNLATMTHSTVDGEDKYAYVLDFDYDDKHIYIDMAHLPDADSQVIYRGRFSFQISESVDYGGNCPSNDVTRNGSLVYNRTGGNHITIESKDAQFCGLEADGLDSDGIVDETMKYSDPSEPNGWANDFNLLRADFDPLTRLGDYAYAWQAGMMDGNVRAFNVLAEDDEDDATEDFSATAFFGYGLDIENDDPSITGFIGNWAGPGNDHTLLEKAQKQIVDFNTTTRKFDSTTANLRYAPTNSLNHPGGGFAFDSNADDTLDATAAFTNELASGIDTDSDTQATIEETMEEAGISVPTAPACLNCEP